MDKALFYDLGLDDTETWTTAALVAVPEDPSSNLWRLYDVSGAVAGLIIEKGVNPKLGTHVKVDGQRLPAGDIRNDGHRVAVVIRGRVYDVDSEAITNAVSSRLDRSADGVEQKVEAPSVLPSQFDLPDEAIVVATRNSNRALPGGLAPIGL